MDLGFDSNDFAAERIVCTERLVDGRAVDSFKYGDVVFSQQGFSLIFVDVHGALQSFQSKAVFEYFDATFGSIYRTHLSMYSVEMYS
jgi:hypothetical protein